MSWSSFTSMSSTWEEKYRLIITGWMEVSDELKRICLF
jgi:hypothetical protein